jgi:hypothetical protein
MISFWLSCRRSLQNVSHRVRPPPTRPMAVLRMTLHATASITIRILMYVPPQRLLVSLLPSICPSPLLLSSPTSALFQYSISSSYAEPPPPKSGNATSSRPKSYIHIACMAFILTSPAHRTLCLRPPEQSRNQPPLRPKRAHCRATYHSGYV